MASKKGFKPPVKKQVLSSKSAQAKDDGKPLSNSQYEEIFDAVLHFQGNRSPVQAESMKMCATEPGESASTGNSQANAEINPGNSAVQSQVSASKQSVALGKPTDASSASVGSAQSAKPKFKRPQTLREALKVQESSSQFSSSLSQLGGSGLLLAHDAIFSQPPKNLRHRERLQWLQDRRGVGLYIQCDICKKWRWSEIDDPVDVPKKWTCRQNPDTNYNQCIIPEKPISVYIEEDLIHNEYTAGSVVWAKLDGFPWWPAMVDDCPDTEQYYWLDGYSDIPTSYHVVFFDYEANEITRSWVPVRDLISFKHQPGLDNKFSLKPGHKSRIASGKLQAHAALKLRVRERLQKYSFLARWTGDIVTPPPSDSELPERSRRRAGKKRKLGAQKALTREEAGDSSDEEPAPRIRKTKEKKDASSGKRGGGVKLKIARGTGLNRASGGEQNREDGASEGEEGDDEEMEASEDEEMESSEDEQAEASEDSEMEASEDSEIEASHDSEMEASEDKQASASDEDSQVSEDSEIEASEGKQLEASEDKQLEASEDEEVDAPEDKQLEASANDQVESSEDEQMESSEDEEVESPQYEQIETSEAKQAESPQPKQPSKPDKTSLRKAKSTKHTTKDAKSLRPDENRSKHSSTLKENIATHSKLHETQPPKTHKTDEKPAGNKPGRRNSHKEDIQASSGGFRRSTVTDPVSSDTKGPPRRSDAKKNRSNGAQRSKHTPTQLAWDSSTGPGEKHDEKVRKPGGKPQIRPSTSGEETELEQSGSQSSVSEKSFEEISHKVAEIVGERLCSAGFRSALRGSAEAARDLLLATGPQEDRAELLGAQPTEEPKPAEDEETQVDSAAAEGQTRDLPVEKVAEEDRTEDGAETQRPPAAQAPDGEDSVSEPEPTFSQDSSMESLVFNPQVLRREQSPREEHTWGEHVNIFENSGQSISSEDKVEDLRRLQQHITRSQTGEPGHEPVESGDKRLGNDGSGTWTRAAKKPAKKTGWRGEVASVKSGKRKARGESDNSDEEMGGKEERVRSSKKKAKASGKENREMREVAKKRTGTKRPGRDDDEKRRKIARREWETERRDSEDTNNDSTVAKSDRNDARNDTKDSKNYSKDATGDSKAAKNETSLAADSKTATRISQVAESDTKLGKRDTKLARSDTKVGKSDTKLARSDTKGAKSNAKSDKSDTKLGKSDTMLARSDTKVGKSDTMLARSDTKGAKSNAKSDKSDTKLGKSDTMLARSDTKGAKSDAKSDKSDTKLGKSDTMLARSDANAKSDSKVAKSDSKLTKSDTKGAKSDTKLAKSDTNAKSDTKLAKSDSKLAKNDSKLAKNDTKLAKNDTTAKSDTKGAKSDTKLAKNDKKVAKNDTKSAKSNTTALSDTKVAKSDTKLANTDTTVTKTATKLPKSETTLTKAGTKHSSTDTNKPSTSGLNTTARKPRKTKSFQPPVRKSPVSHSESSKSEEHSEQNSEKTSSQSLNCSSVAVVPNSEDRLLDILRRLSQESLPFDP